MKISQTPGERQYARVARVFPKTVPNSTNARIKVLATEPGK